MIDNTSQIKHRSRGDDGQVAGNGHIAELENLVEASGKGRTEAAARLSYLPPLRLRDKLGSIGKAIPGVELRLLDKAGRPVIPGEVGEIVARGDNVMPGYWDAPEESAEVLRPEGLRTGDLARMDQDGFFFIVSRKSDMIKSGAHRISPKAIEEILAEHEAVFESAAVGFPDQILGEGIALFVVPRDGAELTEADVPKHCRNNLPRYKIPQKVILASRLPKTSLGKIRRTVLQEWLARIRWSRIPQSILAEFLLQSIQAHQPAAE